MRKWEFIIKEVDIGVADKEHTVYVTAPDEKYARKRLIKYLEDFYYESKCRWDGDKIRIQSNGGYLEVKFNEYSINDAPGRRDQVPS